MSDRTKHLSQNPMLVAEKTHHINVYLYGRGADGIVKILKDALPDLEVIGDESMDDNEEYEEVIETVWFKEIKETMTPGFKLRTRRENKGYTQAELSKRCGIAISNISLMEADKRSIGARSAQKLAAALECSVADFI